VKIFLTGIVLLWALGSCTHVSSPTPDNTADALRHVTYARDPRTGVCFALLRSTTYYSYNVVSLTAVPSEACRP
jgi:hypothetical protein